ncbi:MAG: class I adenylate-forming enzyme family protein, partial [Planctomycetota bacterium]
MSVHWSILRQQIAHPFRTAVIDDQRQWRGIDLMVASLHMASAIERKTDAQNIGIMLPTSGLFPVAALASWMLGRTVVPLNYLLKGDDLEYVCHHAELDTIVSVQPMMDFIGFHPRGVRFLKFEDINFKSIPAWKWPASIPDEELAVILYTSGTTGRPKGVMLTHANLRANVDQCVEWAHFTQRDSVLGVLPQFHSFGLTVLTLLPLARGVKVCFTARFLPRKIISLIRECKPTVMIAIPSMYNALLTVKDAEPDDFKTFRYLVSGGEPLPDAVSKGFKDRFGITINEGFGLTETSPVTHWCRPTEYKPHSVGKPIPHVRQRIVGVNEEEMPVGEEGEIRLAGPNIMKGYYKDPEATAKVMDDQGFFRTGDMGKIDEDNMLYITGRIKEMMIIGGENVFPREIEEVLNSHESVSSSAVIGAPDPARGEVPIAYVETLEEYPFDETSLRSHCRKHLAQYKVPREIHHLEQLHRSPTGKILRRELRESFKASFDAEKAAGHSGREAS